VDARKYCVEFLGTFFLVLTVACCVLQPEIGAFTPLAVGAVLTTMVYAGGHVSGAHYNPAVSLAVWVRGKLPSRDLGPYIVAQVVGAAAAVGLALGVLDLRPPADAPAADAAGSVAPAALVAEFLFTFALAWVVLNVATAPATAGNSYFGLAIGITVMAGAIAVGGISGAHFNPAVSIGDALVNGVVWMKIGLYVLVQLAAGLAAGALFRAIVSDQRPAG